MDEGATRESRADEPVRSGGPYANYVLAVLVVVYMFNFIDRNILSILAEDIKADLGVSDSEMGFLYGTVFAVWVAIAPSTANDLVMPRMRAVAGAYFLLMNTIIGLALGPYLMGRISDVAAAAGAPDAEALRTGMAWGLAMFAFTLVLLLLAMRYLPRDEKSRLERARSLGESFTATPRGQSVA